jgi:mycothiol synthase
MSTEYFVRLYRDETDYEQMRTLLRTTYALSIPPLNFTLGDLDWGRAITNDPDLMSKVQLWFDHTGALAAFTWPGTNQVDIMIQPGHRHLEATILQQAEANQRQRVTPGGEPLTFTCWSHDVDHERNTLLHTLGYTRGSHYFRFHTLPLHHQPAPPTLPPGYTLRHVAGEADLEARVAVHRAAFHPSRMTVEKHRKVMASPTYRADLDLVVVAPDGTFAAYTIVWFDAANRMGIFEPVGCHPDHQRRGLASAVMIEGLRRLHELGATVAHVNSGPDESAGAHLYPTLGFTVIGRTYGWEKQLI